jgi:hypothetical protein
MGSGQRGARTATEGLELRRVKVPASGMTQRGLQAGAFHSAPSSLHQQAHIPNSIMTILEASGKQEPEAKEAPAGPLEEVRAMQPPTSIPALPTLGGAAT